jgi:U3 small nucleolar RNA-associated protein 14
MNTESRKFKFYPVLLLQSRQELAQQLAVSRELTQKVQVENSSDEEEEEEENNGHRVLTNNNDNPWIAPKTTSEVDEFVSEYRKYWEERNKKSSVETGSTNEIAAHEKGEDERRIESDIRKGHTENHETAPANKNVEEKDNVNIRDNNNEDVCIDVHSDVINNNTKTPSKQHSTLEEVSNSTEVQPKRRQLLADKENNTVEQMDTSTEILLKEQNSTIRKPNSSTLLSSQMKNMSPSKQKVTAEQENDISEIIPECDSSEIMPECDSSEIMPECDSSEIMPERVLPDTLNTTGNEVIVSSGMHPKRNISANKQGYVTEGVNSNVKMQHKRKKLSPKKRTTTEKQVSGKKNKIERGFNTSGYKPEPMEYQPTVIATTNSWVVTPIEPEMGKMAECNESGIKRNKRNNENKNTKKNEVEIGKLFDDMKEKLEKKLGKKLKKLKSEMNVKNEDKADDTFSESDNEGPSLKLKRANVQADLDEELVEQPHDGFQETESSSTDLNKILAVSRLHEDKQEYPADNIDPSRFIAMKPKHLRTELPDIVTGGDDVIDDNEDDIAERQMTITEAFADDDVVAEFR